MEKLFKSFEECCADKGYDPNTVIPDLSSYPEELRPALEAAARLLIVHHAHKQGKKFNWASYKEGKHYPWWDMEKEENNPSGFRLRDVHCASTRSGVGSRLSQFSENAARHIATTFESDYRALMVEE